MFARTTFLATALLVGLGALAPAVAQQGAPPAPGAEPAGTPPAGAGAQGHAMAGSAGIQFQTEADARTHCPADKIVWANLTSKAYHLSGTRFYGSGKTKKGAYMCLTDADANGFHKAGTRHAGAAAKKSGQGS